MEYAINYGGFAFAVPGDVVDHYLRLAGEKELKILLFLLRHASANVTAAHAAEFLRIPEEQAAEALEFWEQAGILRKGSTLSTGFSFSAPAATAPADEPPPKPKQDSYIGSQRSSSEIKLDPSEIAAEIEKDTELRDLFMLTEKALGRPLNHTEHRCLLWLHQYLNIPCAIILMLIQYCIRNNIYKISYAESIAIRWQADGILTIEDAETELKRMERDHTFTGEIRKLFEMHRKPTTSQQAFIDQWQQIGYPMEMIQLAYEKNIENKESLSFPYINKLLVDWWEKGARDAESAKKIKPDSKTYSQRRKKDSSTPISQQEQEEMDAYLSLVNRFEEDTE